MINKTLQKNLNNFIDKSTVFIKNKIVEIIENDDDWLKELGISNSDKGEIKNLNELIILKLEDVENYDITVRIIQYVLDDYVLGEDDMHCIFYSYCDADSYSRKSALYVFKFHNKFFCYYLPERFLITDNPIPFCKEAIKDETIQFEIEKENEKENMEEGYFEEFRIELNWNIKINFD
jgi:hypothetical protein